jgi:hypothetical protein
MPSVLCEVHMGSLQWYSINFNDCQILTLKHVMNQKDPTLGKLNKECGKMQQAIAA